MTRLLLLATIAALSRHHQTQIDAARSTAGLVETPSAEMLPALQRLFPQAVRLGKARGDGRIVLDADDEPLGYVVQTSPMGDTVIGFSGPTNVLIGVDANDQLVGVSILSSKDTRDHVQLVRHDEGFRLALRGSTWETAGRRSIDAVSGATLTSLAAAEAIAKRLGAQPQSLRFPALPTLDAMKNRFARGIPEAKAWDRLERVSDSPRWLAYSGDRVVAQILRTVPAGDSIVGYQGPTEAWLLLTPDGDRIVSFALGKSYDNSPYVGYVRDDDYFSEIFKDMRVEELGGIDLFDAQVEGVSGATMTSMAVAESLVATAKLASTAPVDGMPGASSRRPFDLGAIGAVALIVAGIVISLSRLRGSRWLAVLWRVAVVAGLGLAHGDMISQAMLVGWSQHGAPITHGFPLVLMTLAALLIPIVSGRNVYCSHLCAHGAAQQLLRHQVQRRLNWRLRIPPRAHRWLKRLPAALLVLVALTAFGALPFDLVDLEPFDAWLFLSVGASAIIAVVGLAWSAVTPMAYCRFACPTGALLDYARRRGGAGRWQAADSLALTLTAISAFLTFS